MAYVKPEVVVENMIHVGAYKANLAVRDILIRGFLSGALLGYATTLAYTATVQTGTELVGAFIFPVGFVMIILLGLELVTGNFALVPLAVMEGKTSLDKLVFTWSWVFLGNLLGSVFYALLFYVSVTKMGNIFETAIAKKIMTVTEAKTIGYTQFGMAGIITAFVSAILCNWMVTLGAVMALTSTTTAGKIVAMWLPILTFFAQGYEHAVVNMFVIPAGIILGANVSIYDWWIWNQIPVTIGNIVGGLTFTGFALYLTHGKREL